MTINSAVLYTGGMKIVSDLQADYEVVEQKIIAPSEVPPKRRQKPEELKHFLQANTLAVVERMVAIATDTLYTRGEDGERQRVPVPVGAQLQAAIAFLDRSLGKPQVNVDITSEGRPVVFDQAFAAPPLTQGGNE